MSNKSTNSMDGSLDKTRRGRDLIVEGASEKTQGRQFPYRIMPVAVPSSSRKFSRPGTAAMVDKHNPHKLMKARADLGDIRDSEAVWEAD